jgi:Zn-dependent protease
MACRKGQKLMSKIIFDVATWLVPLAIAIVFHEVAHGRVAKHFGDPTASDLGRLSLNPIRHIDPFGTVILPTLLAVTGAPIFGWAKPVPIQQSRLRNPRWHMVLVAAAGPASNILLALTTALGMGLALRILGDSQNLVAGFVVANLANFISINLFLAVFNMIPIPPFDGSKVVAGFLPPQLGAKFQALDRYALLFMIGLLVVLPRLAPQANVIARIVIPPVQWLYDQMGQIITALA